MTVRDVLMSAAGGASASSGPLYVEDVFSTYLYTGNGSTQTINNGIALADGPGDVVAPTTVFGTEGSYTATTTNAPFGVADNLSDSGWIMDYPSSEYFTYDFGSAKSDIKYISFYSVYTGGQRGARFQIQTSNDNVNFTNLTTVDYITLASTGYGGLYTYSLPAFSARYVKVFVISNLTYSHAPRTSTVKFSKQLAGKGGMVWIKSRASATSNFLIDTLRGPSEWLSSNSTAAVDSYALAVSSFNANGFTLGLDSGGPIVNGAGDTYASWTFRKAPKFFDVVTYTGNGDGNTTINHLLGSVPGMIIIKRIDGTSEWGVWHRGDGTTARTYMSLNSTASSASTGTFTGMTSTTFRPGGVQPDVNGIGPNMYSAGVQYVAYLFAHNAGGFGAAGTDNVISCGSYTGNGSTNGPVVTLGYEPQWVLIKNTSGNNDWRLHDTMRGIATGGADPMLFPNTSQAELGGYDCLDVSATGFQLKIADATYNANGSTYIYIAIRRGPMKTPTSGTSVFSPATWTGNSSARSISGVGFSPDSLIIQRRSADASFGPTMHDRLRGSNNYLRTNANSAEVISSNGVMSFNQDGFSLGANAGGWNASINTVQYVSWVFKRAPGFFDEVCYTGTGVTRTVNHNLGVAPELMVVKRRSSLENWGVYAAPLGPSKNLRLDSSNSEGTDLTQWGDTFPTQTVFTVGGADPKVNASGSTYVACLFASCPGVSKVGSYTGNGTTGRVIDCGFSNGARFVLLKRTDDISGWFVWDSARGITSGNDPWLMLNLTNAENTTTDYIDPVASGFALNEFNQTGAQFIYLAIA